MEKQNTSLRLKKLMSERNLKQVDILNACSPFCQKYDVKMNKSDISQYVSGKVEPNQDKLFVLGSALNVSEAWLMGYDVPMERDIKSIKEYKEKMLSFSKEWNIQYYEKQMLESFYQLNETNKKKTIGYTRNLLSIQQLEDEQKDLEPQAAHDRTDVEVTDEMIKHDDDIMNDDKFWSNKG